MTNLLGGYTFAKYIKFPDDIQKRLKISYDALHEKEQQIFLDIACFFIGEKKNTTINMGRIRLERFVGVSKSREQMLGRSGHKNYIHMHDHLRDLGREIAEDKLPRRLWHPNRNIDDLAAQAIICKCSIIQTFKIVKFFHRNLYTVFNFSIFLTFKIFKFNHSKLCTVS
jgi:hypothetical protein